MPADRVLELGEFRVDVAGRTLSRGGKLVALPPKAVETLILLAQNPGRTVLKEELLEKVWPDTFVEEGSLTQAISILRKALGDVQWIRTVPKRGYCFVGPVRVASDEPPRRRRRIVYAAIAAAVLIAIGTLLFWNRRTPRAASPHERLVVLPVENLSGNAQHDYVSDGLTEELIAKLSTLDANRLAVIARTSSMTYKGTHKSIDEIARELDVDYVLESSLRWSGNRLRITAQLIRTQDQSHLWTGTYDRTAQDMLSMQDELAQAIATQIDTKLPGNASRRAPDAQAYLPYLEGRYYWNKRTRDSIAQAIVLLQRSIALDPRFARAHSALADCYMSLGLLGAGRPAELFAAAKNEARQALALDPDLAEAHTSLAYLEFWDEWDWPGAESEFRKAIALNPDYATAHQWYAEYLRLMGRFDESIVESGKALALDPLSLVINMEAGLPYYFRGQYDRAAEHFQKAIRLDPHFALAYVELGWVYEDRGDTQTAIATLQKAAQLDNTNAVMAALANAYAAAGRTAEARQALDALQQRAKTSYVSPFLLATIQLRLGDKQTCLALLERAYQEHDWALIWSNVSPRFHTLRSDPRFQSLLARMKFPPRTEAVTAPLAFSGRPSTQCPTRSRSSNTAGGSTAALDRDSRHSAS